MRADCSFCLQTPTERVHGLKPNEIAQKFPRRPDEKSDAGESSIDPADDDVQVEQTAIPDIE